MTTLPLAAIQVSNRFRRDLGDLRSLAASIRELGLLHPVVVNRDNLLIAGQRRLEACRILGWAEVPVNVVDLAEVVRGEHAENVERRDFLPSEAVAIAAALRPAEEQKARERQATQDFGRGVTPGNLPEVETGRVADRAAAYAGLGRRTLEKAEAVVAAGRPELVALMDSTGKVDRAYRELKKAETQLVPVPPLPKGKYRLLLADPPWSYVDKAANTGHWAGAENHYPCLSTDALCALQVDGRPVQDLAAEDSLLFLWATAPLLPDAMRVLGAWGFGYRTIAFTWVKRNGDGSPLLGLGNYTRGNAELCLLGRRGRGVERQSMSVSSIIESPRMRHSQKPAVVRDRIVELCGEVARIELFAREHVEGWAAWGNQLQQEALRFNEATG